MSGAALVAASSMRAEQLTLAVLMCGVASLALSDFVSPFYWLLSATAALLRLWRGSGFSLTELQASLIGWFGFFWVALELVLGRAWVVAFTDFMLILALAVVIEAPTPRNHLHRMLVGLFLVLAAAVLTDSVLYVIPLVAMMWFMWRAAACLYGLNWPGGDLPAVSAGQDARWMILIAAMAAFLFVSLPRFDTHSLLKPTQPRMQTSGFSYRVQLGDFARELDATVVMRVEPAVANLTPVALKKFRREVQGRYWRGVALPTFTGQGWQHSGRKFVRHWPRGGEVVLAKGQGLQLAVYREASDHAYIQLPQGLLNIRRLSEAVQISASGAMSFDQPPSRRLRLQMEISGHGISPLAAMMRPPAHAETSKQAIPAVLYQWVNKISRGMQSPAAALRVLADELRGWTYDLHAKLDDARPLESFLAQKKGHCELYATTLALAARVLGVPSRVVNGYYGGEWNDVGGFLLLRQQHAHSWTEVWLHGHWQRMDATPASRWELLGVRFPAFDEVWETIKLNWYRYVLEFQDSDRTALLKQLWQQLRSYGAGLLLVALFVAAVIGLIRVFPGVRFWQYFRTPTAAWPLLDRWLEKHGSKRHGYQPLRCLPIPAGVDAARWQAFVQDWERQAYAGTHGWHRRELKRHLRAL